MIGRRLLPALLRELAATSVAMALVLVAGSLMLVVPDAFAQTVTPVPLCTAVNVLGFPYSGLVCGGSVLDNCTPGALYQCSAGFPQDNCTFAQACAVGCLTGPTSTSITLNTSAPTAADACFTGPPPLTLSTNSTLGGNDVTLTATLTEPHAPFGADISLLSIASLVPSLCGGGRLAPDATSLSFDRPTAVVTAPTAVPLSLLIGYIPDPTTGKGRTLVSTPTVLTLNPGGVELPQTVSSFTLTPSTISPGQGSSIALTMTRASASTIPNQITVTSSNPSVAFSNEQPGPTVAPGCSATGGTIWSANFVPDTTAVTISASAQGQVPVTNVLTVTATPLNWGGPRSIQPPR